MTLCQIARLCLFISAFYLSLGLAACETSTTHSTPSGKVEALFNGISKQKLKDRLTSEMINRGYSINRSDDMTIVFDKPIQSLFVAATMGSKYDGTPNARVTYNLVQINKAIRVIADLAVITNPGSAFERRNDANNSPDSVQIAGLLSYLKYEIENGK